jgi:hypothetical protein
MSTTSTEVLAFPNIRAIVRDNGTAEVIVAGNSRIVPAGESLQDLRNNALALVVGEAQTLNRPVRVQIEDPEGHGELIVHPDNKIESVSYEVRPPAAGPEAPEATPEAVAPWESLIPSRLQRLSLWMLPESPRLAAVAAVDRQPWPPRPVAPEDAAPAAGEATAGC